MPASGNADDLDATDLGLVLDRLGDHPHDDAVAGQGGTGQGRIVGGADEHRGGDGDPHRFEQLAGLGLGEMRPLRTADHIGTPDDATDPLEVDHRPQGTPPRRAIRPLPRASGPPHDRLGRPHEPHRKPAAMQTYDPLLIGDLNIYNVSLALLALMGLGVVGSLLVEGRDRPPSPAAVGRLATLLGIAPLALGALVFAALAAVGPVSGVPSWGVFYLLPAGFLAAVGWLAIVRPVHAGVVLACAAAVAFLSQIALGFTRGAPALEEPQRRRTGSRS